MKKVIKKIQDTIKSTIFENKTFIAGGYVRDMLLNRYSQDIDLVVNLPQGGTKLAYFLYENKISSKPVVYKTFGTAKVLIDNYDIELVMTRKESYRKNNRYPEVEFGSIEEDVFRRDFTINTLLWDISNENILDLTKQGISDLNDKIIRTPLNPDIVFQEDALRILRGIRFASQLNFSFEDKTLEGLKSCAKGITFIPVERIKEEFIKILISANPQLGLELIRNTLVYKYFLPEMEEMFDVAQNKYHTNDVWHHTLDVVSKVPPKLIIRMVALFHDIGKKRCKKTINGDVHFYHHENESAEMSSLILRRLRFSEDIIRKVKYLIKNHMRLKQAGENGEIITDKTLRKLYYSAGNYWDDLLDLIHADNLSHAKDFQKSNQIVNIRERIKSIVGNHSKIHLPINGIDLMDRFHIKGPIIGKLLGRAHELYYENPDISKEEILKKISSLIEF